EPSSRRRMNRTREFRRKEIDARGKRSAEVETDAAGVNCIFGYWAINVIQFVAQSDAEPREIVRRKLAHLGEAARLLQAGAAHQHRRGGNEVAPREAVGGAAATRWGNAERRKPCAGRALNGSGDVDGIAENQS